MIICFTFTKKSDQIYVCISDDMRLLLNIIGGRGQLVRTQDPFTYMRRWCTPYIRLV